MSIQAPAYGLPHEGWRGPAVVLLGSAIAFGVPSAILASYGFRLGEITIPLLPSGIAFLLLVAFGWRAMPGIAAGATGAAACAVTYGSAFPDMTAAGWFLLLPLGGCAQAAVSYALARRVSPNLLETSSTWELWRFLLISIPVGTTVGAACAWVAMGPASGDYMSQALNLAAAWWVLDIAVALAFITFCLGFVSRAPRPFLPVAMLSAIFGIVLGASVIYGWITDNTFLISLAPPLPPMSFNAALCFILCGLGLMALVADRLLLARAAGLVLILFGGLTFLQYAFHVNVGIDEIFLADVQHLRPEYPGRMSASAALCYFLYGLALTQRGFGSGAHIAASTLFSFVASIGAIRFLSHMMDIDTDHGWARMGTMALHAATGWTVLGLGGIAREVLRADGDSRRLSLAPLPTGVALAAMSIWIWQAVYHSENDKIRRMAQERVMDITRTLDKEMTYHNNTMLRLASRWDRSIAYTPGEWSIVAKMVLRDFPSVGALAWADADSYIRWLEPMDDAENIIGFQLSAHPHGAEVLREVHETGKQVSSKVIELRPMGKGLIVFTPTVAAGKIEGYMLGLYRLDRLFQTMSTSMENYNYIFRVFEGNELVYISHEDRDWPVDPIEAVQIDQVMHDGMWKLQLVPKPEWLEDERSNIPRLILFSGIFLSFLATYALYLLEKVRDQYHTIRVNENRLREVFDCAPTGLITVDRFGMIEDLNPEAQRQFAYSTAELIGKPMENLVPGQFSEAQLRVRLMDTQKERCGEPEKQELIALKKDGTQFPVEVAVTPYQTHEGVQILALITDISERDEAQRKLLAYTRALEVSNRDLDDFAYVASHDLRAPLTAIGSLVVWLEEDTADVMPESSAKHLRLIKGRVARMGKLLEDLLDYSRAGRTANAVELVNMEQVVAQVNELLRDTRPLEVRTGGLPIFETVRTPFHQILHNLMANSIKHHDRDSCLIEITAQDSGAFYTIRVTDDGPGIPSQFHDKVFSMFQTLRPRDEVEGSGMGLALVKRLVERYGGKVAVVESDGRGTTIEFTWPKNITGG